MITWVRNLLPVFAALLASFIVVSSASATPSITSLSRSSGAVGAAVTITGTGFGSPQGSSTVKFNGTSATASSWTATSISVTVPTGATTGNVVVNVSGVNSNGVSFTVVTAPHISSLSGTSGAVGAPGTITGTNFGASQGDGNVTFNGTVATITSWSATSIATSVPVGATTGNVVVYASGVNSNGINFTVLPTPTITSLSRTTGAVGATVTVSGTGFGTTQTGTSVKFNGTTATVSSWTATAIVVTVPTGATSGNVVVHASGVNSNGSAFTVVSAPSITSLSVGSGTVGTPVTVTGTNFGSSQADGTVTFNGTTAGVTSWSATAIKVTVPSGATTGSVVVHASGVDSNGISFSVTGQSNGPITYIYDDLNRLTGVVDAYGSAAAYSYDAVGNIQSIARIIPAQVSIIDFSPLSGSVGASVTINGTGFSTNGAQDTVTFNGTNATVTSATATQIVATVPSGSTSGTIHVTCPGGSATSASSFSVVAASGPPTITSFTPSMGTAGTSVTLTGTNFDTVPGNNRLTFNLTSQSADSVASSTSMAVSVPVATASGPIGVETIYGSGVSSQDFYIPFLAHVATDIGVATRISIGGNTNVAINTANKIGMVIFSASAGQRVGVQTTGGTYSFCALYLFDAHGVQLATGSCTGSSNLLSAPVLSHTGTYTIGIDPGGSTGSLSLTLNDITDVTTTISPGGPPVTVTTTVAGQDARLMFTGAIGQKVSLLASQVSNPLASVSLVWPTGAAQNGININNQIAGQTFFLDTETLPFSAGSYTVLVQHIASGVGSETLQLYDASDVTGTLSVDGSATQVTTAVLGQDARLTFSATAGQRVFTQVNSVSNPQATVVLLEPDGTTQASVGINNSGQVFAIDTQTLSASGIYTVWVQHSGPNIGSETLQVTSVPPDITGTIAINGSSVRVPTTGNTAAGQNASLTFTGSTGQSITASFSGSTFSGTVSCLLTLKDPSGNAITSVYCGSSAGNPLQATLSTNGTYTLFLDPQGAATGSISLSLTSP